ncbi:MAG: HD domain-containing protein [Asgard group archaeon]|nr:HD domain-containing protein [Asgard group archaeon]
MLKKMNHQNPPKQSITGIILSGGYSTRFQEENKPWIDKALMTFNGEVILQRTTRMLSNLCDKIIIMVKFEERKSIYLDYIDRLPGKIKSKVLITKDNKQFLCNGPTLGIVSSLDFIESDLAVVVPVDLPLINEKILMDLISQLNNSSMTVPFWSTTGKIEPLVFAFKFKPIQIPARIISHIKRSRADDLHRAISNIRFIALSSDKITVLERIFTSLNDKDKLEKINTDKESQASDIFDFKNSLVVSEKVNEDLLTRLESFLSKNNFMKPLEETLLQTMELSKELLNHKMFFFAGVLLFNIISKFALGEKYSEKDVRTQLINLCIKSFKHEASQWQNQGIRFLELHSLSDAYIVANMFNKQDQKELENEIIKLKELLGLKKKKHEEYSLDFMLENKIPLFLKQAEEMIQKSEKAFNEGSPSFTTNFLWDHSFRVGKIAYKLALKEGIDPLVPTIAAILHDAGKFVLGKYHDDDKSEEEHSSSIAEELLVKSGLSKNVIEAVKIAIKALYNEKFECNINCKIVHDADRLEKLGPLGIANFFTKMTLRGINLSSSILTNLSRELTYTAAAPETMLTKTGKKLAYTRTKKALLYFEELLEEFVYYDLGRFHVKEFKLDTDQEIILVIPENCNKCKGEFSVQLTRDSGIKCEKVIANYSCNKCTQKYKTEFCLPLILQKN